MWTSRKLGGGGNRHGNDRGTSGEKNGTQDMSENCKSDNINYKTTCEKRQSKRSVQPKKKNEKGTVKVPPDQSSDGEWAQS